MERTLYLDLSNEAQVNWWRAKGRRLCRVVSRVDLAQIGGSTQAILLRINGLMAPYVRFKMNELSTFRYYK